jgi:hypothetical protein
MSHAFPSMPPVRLDEQGRIDVDVSCAQCGYNLRMRHVGESCPECGKVIEATVNDAELSLADAGWRQRVRSAARQLWLSVAIAFPLIYPGLALAMVAVWRLTEKEPGRAERRSVWVQRILARGLTTLGIAASIATASWGLLRFREVGIGGGEGWRTFDMLFSGSHATAVIGLMWVWRYLYNLAARADAPEAAQAIRQLWKRYFFGLIGLGVIAVLVNAFEMLDINRIVPPIVQNWQLLPVGMFGLLAALLVWEWGWTLHVTRRLAKAL